MVIVKKATKRVKGLIGKRFVDDHKAKSYIDAFLSEEYIERTKLAAYKDILRLGV
jgi:ribose 5-phosphate isomerase RpiB